MARDAMTADPKDAAWRLYGQLVAENPRKARHVWMRITLFMIGLGFLAGGILGGLIAWVLHG